MIRTAPAIHHPSSVIRTRFSGVFAWTVALVLAFGDSIKVKGVAFGAGAASFTARVASTTGGGTVEVRLGGPSGPVVGRCGVPNTGGRQVWTTLTYPVSGATGTQDLHLRSPAAAATCSTRTGGSAPPTSL
nr:carbohydrate-binding protein [Streptomyces sp. SID12488]